MSMMIVKVWTEKVEATANGYPYIVERYIEEQDDMEFVSRHRTMPEAKQAARDLGAGHHVSEEQQNPEGWIVNTEWQDGSGFASHDPDTQAPWLRQEDAEADADKMRAKIGVVDQHMMASSSYCVIVLRPIESDVTLARNRWTAALGLGGHTVHVKGSYATEVAAESAARDELQRRWNNGLGYWRRIAERAGVECRVTATPPEIKVLRPHKGVSAWDAYASEEVL